MAVVVYSSGLCACSACAPTDVDQRSVEEAVNLALPTGIDSRWRVSSDPQFKGGQSNPCACEQDASRRHWLLEC